MPISSTTWGVFNVEVDQADLAEVTKRLGGLEMKARIACKNAANTAAVHARNMLQEHAQARYTIKNVGFRDHMDYTKATVATLTAILKGNGRPITLPRFRVAARGKSGVKAEVLKGSGLKPVTKGTIKSFMGIAKNSDAKLVLQRKGRARLPLRSHHGPSVPKMLEMVWDGGGITDAGMKEEIAQFYRSKLEQYIEETI